MKRIGRQSAIQVQRDTWAMPLSRTLSPAFSPADAVRRALIGSLYEAHRPELADVVASADLALEFPGVWLWPLDRSLNPDWLEGKFLEAAVASGLPLAWIRVLSPAGQGSEGMKQRAWWCRACGHTALVALGWCRRCYDRQRHSRLFYGGYREQVLVRDGCCQVCWAGQRLVVHHRRPGHGKTGGARHAVPALPCPAPLPAAVAGGLWRTLLPALAGAASGVAGAVAPAAHPMSESGDALVPAGFHSPGVLIAAVLSTLTSEKTQQAYATALADFFEWTAKRGEPLSKPLVEAWRGALLARGLSVSSVNQRLSAIRLLVRQAADRGALTAEEARRLASVPNIKQAGQRLGKWLTEGEAGKLLGVPDPKTRIGRRDRALLALLVACGLRRDELVRLEVRHLQLRDERWVLLGSAREGTTAPHRAGSALGETTPRPLARGGGDLYGAALPDVAQGRGTRPGREAD